MQVLPNQEEVVAMSFGAWELYDNEIIGQLTDADFDKNVAIDVKSGDWEVGGLNESMKRLRERQPCAEIVNIFHERPCAERFDWISVLSAESATEPIE